MASNLLDDIIISNQPASERELKELSQLKENSFNFSIKLENNISQVEYDSIFNSEVEYLGKIISNHVRQDYSSYMIRCSAPRIKFSKNPIKARKLNTKTFKVGDVLVLNELSGRYNGEVQIITKEIPLGILHQNGLEHTDIYTGYARLTILSQNQEQTLELERAKGKLVIFCRNFPTEVAQMSLKLSPVY